MGYRNHHRAGSTCGLAGLVIGVIFGLSASAATGNPRPAVPGAWRSIGPLASPAPEPARRLRPPVPKRSRHGRGGRTRDRPRPRPRIRPPTPAKTTTRPPTPDRTTTRPPTSAAVVPTRTTTTKAPAGTPAASASDVAVAAEAGGIGPFGWLVVIGLLAAMVIGGLLLYRSQRKSAWDTEARALEAETRTVIATRLGPVLTATTAGQRGLDVVTGENYLGRPGEPVERSHRAVSGELRRNWSLQVSGLLQDLIAAVDAENEALAVGRDWTLLRPRVSQAEQALSAVLAGRPWPEPPPAAEEPGPPAFQN